MQNKYKFIIKKIIMEEQSTVKGRLELYLKSINESNREFSRKIGVSPSYISLIRRSIPKEKLQKIKAAYPELNQTWLMTGFGTMRVSDGENDSDVITLPLSAWKVITQQANSLNKRDEQLQALVDALTALVPKNQ